LLSAAFRNRHRIEATTIGDAVMAYFNQDEVFVIAEIGSNHEGDFERAKKLLRLASESGANAVKFQVYTGDTLVNRLESPTRHQHFKRFELTYEQYIELAEIAKELKTMFMASIWNREALEILNPYISIYKIGSGDLNAYEMIEATVRTGKPMIMSCGLATMADLEEVVQYIGSLDPSYIHDRKLCLLQCTVMYPIPDSDANLKSMILIKERTGLPVGFSDHTVGTYASEIAVSMGAQVIEKHFTDQREGRQFRDHKISLTREEMQELVHKFKKIKELQGTYDKRIMPSEIENECRISFRRAVYPRRDLRAGTLLTREDIISLRPNVGIDGKDYFKLLGKRLKADKKAYERMSWDDVE